MSKKGGKVLVSRLVTVDSTLASTVLSHASTCACGATLCSLTRIIEQDGRASQVCVCPYLFSTLLSLHSRLNAGLPRNCV